MNDNNLNFNNNGNDNYNNDTYRATTNLNVAMENPQADFNSATAINIQNDSNNFGMNNGNLYNNGMNNNDLYNNGMNNGNLYNSGTNGDNFPNNQFDSGNTFQDNNFSTNNNINNGFGVENTYVANNQVSDMAANAMQMQGNMPNNMGGDFSAGNAGQSSFLPGGASQPIDSATANMYAPTLEKNKKPKASLVVPKELKAMIVIIIILIIVVFVMPYVYDILRESGLIITSG